MTRRIHRQRARRGVGQSVAEFAIILPVLALIFLSILQIAMMIGAQIGLTNAAREAARIASITVTPDSGAATSNGDAVLSRLQTVILPTNVMAYSSTSLDSGDCIAGTGTRITYTSATDVGGAWAVFVRVDVEYHHSMFVPLVGLLLDALDGTPNDGFKIGASEELRVDNLPFDAAPSGVFPVCRP